MTSKPRSTPSIPDPKTKLLLSSGDMLAQDSGNNALIKLWEIHDLRDFDPGGGWALVTARTTDREGIWREGLAIPHPNREFGILSGDFYPGIRSLTDADKALIHLGRPDLIRARGNASAPYTIDHSPWKLVNHESPYGKDSSSPSPQVPSSSP